ncbi:MAG: DNA repair protein RecN [Candidatus Aminicenantales bacterium]
MIKSLRIKNLATIEEIELRLQEGFSILTGETGAGKSIIIDGLRLVLGERGSAELIRTGKQETSIEAIFSMPQVSGSVESGHKVYMQRRISEEGSGKGYIDGVLVPMKKLKERGELLVDIYGQNDHAFLRKTENQLDYLDRYAEAIPLRSEVASSARELRRLLREKRELEARERERGQRLDFLEFQIKEIEKANLKKGEEEELLQERNILKNAEKIRTLIDNAFGLSYEKEDSIIPLMSKLQPVVHELSSFDKAFKEVEDAINQFSITLQEFSGFLINFKDRHDVSPQKLEKIEERLSQIERLKRKYGSSIEEILAHLERARKEFDQLSRSQEKLEELDKEIRETFKVYKAKAGALTELRAAVAHELEKKIEKEIILLGMKKARFKIEIISSSPRPEEIEKVKEKGCEEVEFLISPNPGEELRPLRKIASGGEISRVMLALKSIGKESERLKTLIFDEIDSGIGGRTAECVAQKLRDLSRKHQVICITHLPQIASYAPHHYRIEKKVIKNRTYTFAKKLSFEERVNEIARLLTGTRVTETTLRSAREMLAHNLGREDFG